MNWPDELLPIVNCSV